MSAIHHPDTEAQKEDVERVLRELGLEERLAEVVEVWNKLDLVGPGRHVLLLEQARGSDRQVAISAKSGEGCERFLAIIEARLFRSRSYDG